MAISRELKINITGKTAKFDKEVFLYQGDKNIDLNIEIIDSEYKYDRLTKGNILRLLEGELSADIKIVKPDKSKLTVNNVSIVSGKLVFRVTSDLIDELKEIGVHYLQIFIHADEASKHIPKVEFEVVEPLFMDESTSFFEDAKAGEDKTNECVVAKDSVRYALRANGDYVATNWQTGDLITAAKLNKIEAKVKELDTSIVNKAPTNHTHSNYANSNHAHNEYASKSALDEHISNHPSGGGGSTTVVDNLTSTSTTSALSANQGKVLDNKITVLSGKMDNHLVNHPSGDGGQIPPNVANPNLVCWYEIDDKNNDSKDREVWKDKSGNGNDLTLYGFDFENNGWIDGNLVFDGINTYAYNPSLLPVLSESNDLVIEITATCTESINAYNLIFSMFKDYDNYEGIRVKGGTSIDFNTKTSKKSLTTGVAIGNEFSIKLVKIGSSVELFVNGTSKGVSVVDGVFQHNIPFTLGCGLTKDGKPTLFSKCKIKSLKIEVPSWNTPTLTLPNELNQLSVRNINELYFEKASKIDELFIDGIQYKPINKVEYMPKCIGNDKNIFIEVKYKNDTKYLTHSIKTLPSDFYNLKITGKSPYCGEYYMTKFGVRSGLKDYVFAISNDGEITFYKELKGSSMCFRKYEVNGKVRYTYLEMNGYKKPDFGAGFGFCDLVVLDEDFKEIDRATLKPSGIVVDGYPFEQHDYIYIDDGHYIGLAYVGIDVSDIPNLNGSYKVVSAVIQEIKNGNVLMQFDSTKYPSLYLDSMENNQYEQCPSAGTSYKDYAHINSIKIDPLDNNIIASFRNLDCVMKIDRLSGEIIWTLGGKSDDFGLTTEQKFARQHDATICSDGSILIFNNNNGKGVSSAKRFWLDESNKTLVKCDNYANLDGRTITAMGGAIEVHPSKKVYGVSWGMQAGIETLQEIDFETNRKLLGIEIVDDAGYIYKAFRTFENVKSVANNEEIRLIKNRLSNIEGLDNNAVSLVPIPPSENIDVESVSLNKPTHSFKVDETVQLNATILPSNASNKTVSWSSSDTSKASVSNTGLVTAKSVGECIVTVTTQDGNKSDICSLIISEKDEINPPAGDIVTDGLISWIDLTGISGTPSIITDKSGNNNNLTLFNATDGFRSDGLLFNGVDTYGKLDIDFATKDVTIEITFKKLEDETAWGKVLHCNNANLIIQSTPSGVETNIFNMGNQKWEKAIVNKKYCCTLVTNAEKCSHLLNKEKRQNAQNTDDVKYKDLDTIFIGKASTNRDYFKGLISSIRVYDRNLTDEEILHNQTVELG